MNEEILVEVSADEAIEQAARRVVTALSGDGVRSIALAGGSTPKALYELLATPLWRRQVDWSKVEWFWGDERAVPPTHADSNYAMAYKALLEPLGIADGRIHRMPADAPDLNAAAVQHETQLRRFVSPAADGIPVFDLVLLGMGNDGHTASLFPGSTGLDETKRLVVAHHVPSLGVQRMTLTYPVIQAARETLFLVTGAAKAEVLARVLSPKNDSGLPSAALRPGGKHAAKGHLVWILDQEAARIVKNARTP